MAVNWDQLSNKLNQLLHNYAEFGKKYYDFFAAPPKDIPLEFYDENGNLISKNIPNVAKLKVRVDTFVDNARREFSAANICPNPELIDSDNDGYPDGLSFANTFVESISVITPKKNGSEDEQVAYKLIAFALVKDANRNINTGNVSTIANKFKVLKVTADFSKLDSLQIFFRDNYFVGRGENKQIISRGCFYYLPEDYTGKVKYRWDEPYGEKIIYPSDNTAFTHGFHKWLEIQTIRGSSFYNFIFSVKANNYTGKMTVYIALPFIIGGFSYGFGVKA